MQQLVKLKQQAAAILDLAQKQGATAAEIALNCGTGLNVTVREQKVEELEFDCEQNCYITLYLGQSKGTASITTLNEDAIMQAISAALAIAKYTQSDPCAGLADAALMAKTIVDLDLNHPWQITPEQAIKQTLSCEQAAFAYDQNITQGNGTSLATWQNCTVYANSHHFIAGVNSTNHSLSCSMIAGTGSNMQSDYFYDVKCSSQNLLSAEQIGKQTAQNCLAKLGAKSIATTNASVLFAPQVAPSLFRNLLAALNGRNLYRKNSFLLDKIDQKIMPNWLQISEQPHILKGLASASFDSDGLATYAKNIITDGVVQTYLLDTYSARKLGLKSTANAGGASNITVSSNTQNLQSIISNLKKGLLVTEFMGNSTNLLTGDYSRGVAGFWIENGQIQFPVQEVTIAGNLNDMFKQISAVGADIETRSSILVGATLIDNMTIAGN